MAQVQTPGRLVTVAGWLRSSARPLTRGAAGLALMLAVGPVKPVGAQVAYQIFTPRRDVQGRTGDASAQPDKGRQRARVSLVIKDSTVKYVLDEVGRQTGMRVAYDPHLAALLRRISVHLTDVSLEDALPVITQGTGLVARVTAHGEALVVGPQGGARDQSAVTTAGVVAGKVVDSASGKGIGGAAVVVQGTALKTTTAETGQFTLRDVPTGEQLLRVRAFGYKAATEKVTVTDSERVTVHIVLRPAPTVLSGVVTTATGVQQRRQLGNDITVLNADSIQQVAPVSTLTDMLETRVPGLTVLRESGIPGAPRRVRLRGPSSLERSDDPILIVDGVRVNADQSGKQTAVGGAAANAVGQTPLSGQFYGPSPLDQIDPNSIETIEVFKGPSASAMYGADAGNGVIVVTTKRGRAGKTRWNLTLDDGRTSLPSGGYPLNTFRFGQITNSHILSQSALCLVLDVGLCTTDSVVRYQALNDPRFNVFGQGQSRQASLTTSGGIGQLTYALTGSAQTETGLFQLPVFEIERFQTLHSFPAPDWMRHPDQYSTWSGTSHLDLPLTPNGASVALTTSYFNSQQQQSSLQGAVAILLNKYIDTTDLLAPTPLVSGYTRVQIGSASTLSQVTLHWPLKGWMPLDVTGGLQSATTSSSSVLPHGYDISGDSAGLYSAVLGQTDMRTLTAGTALLAPPQGRRPGVRMPVGFNWTSNSAWSMSGASGPAGLPPGVLSPTSLGGGSQSNVTTTTYGWYVAPTLDLNSRFFASPGIRFDGGSASGSHGGFNGGNFSPFPKLDFAWLAVENPEHPVLGAITLLRPRVAFGIAGVQPDPTSQYRLLQTTTGSAADGTPYVATFLTSYGNTKLKPERSRELEGGFDTELWNQRLTLTLTGYHKLRYNAIETSPIAPSVGLVAQSAVAGTSFAEGSYAYNVGTIRNTGVDATATARVLDTRAALWQLTANVGKNTNQLLRLAPGVLTTQSEATSGTTRLIPGYPIDGVWSAPIVGYADVNQNGRIDPGEVHLGDSLVYLGSPEPNYALTVSTNLSLFNGRLSINTAVDYQNGLTQIYSAAVADNGGNNTGDALTSALNDPATPLSRQAAIMASMGGGSVIGLAQTVNTLRWQSLSVNYQAPQRLAQWFRVNSLSVALQGSNLGLHTNYRGKDPNIGFTPGSNSVADTGQLPQPRLWQLHITLGN